MFIDILLGFVNMEIQVKKDYFKSMPIQQADGKSLVKCFYVVIPNDWDNLVC